MALDLLPLHLSFAVPLEIATLAANPRLLQLAQANMDGYAQHIADHGDLLMYRSERKGENAQVMATLTQALAVLAFREGGVDFAGLHFEHRVTAPRGESNEPEPGSLAAAD